MFKCKDCGLEYNRDLNSGVNIGNRLLGYMLRGRAGAAVCDRLSPVNQPKTPPVYSIQLAIQHARGEATVFRRW